MTPEEFIGTWRGNTSTEKESAQQHFLELCELLEVPKPRHDPGFPAKDYGFEKGVKKPGGKPGFVDVWRKGKFIWEYKRSKKSLVEAYRQLNDYRDDLGNPPLLIVSDTQEIQVHTNFTNTPKEQRTYSLLDLRDPAKLAELRWVFSQPERFRRDVTPQSVTEETARAIGTLAVELSKVFGDAQTAHFLNKVVFCMFAERIDLLPDLIFSEILEEGVRHPAQFEAMVRELFGAMRNRNGRFGKTAIAWFDGGLFEDDDVLALNQNDIRALRRAAQSDWSKIEPSIFGSLFEAGLDPEKRKQMAGMFDPAVTPPNQQHRLKFLDPATDRGVGIHYTDSEKIKLIIDPVVIRPLAAEWAQVKAEIGRHRAAKASATTEAAKIKAETAARDAYMAFRHRLGKFRVLDPACGSGNFLYVALVNLKDFDRSVEREARALGLQADNERVTTEAVLGIEASQYAAELAQLTVWIGELQWQLSNFGPIKRAPILSSLKQIRNGDALFDDRTGKETLWPRVDAIVGNPPFLGGKLLNRTLKESYVKKLFDVFDGRVPAESDLVCYWFAKAGEYVRHDAATHVGLVATNSIRGGANRKALEYALRGDPKSNQEPLQIYDAWDDEPWTVDGAAVRVSLICFASAKNVPDKAPRLDGHPVEEIHSDLTARRWGAGVDLTKAKRLNENADVAFMGDTKGGAFDVPGELARFWLEQPLNPNGRPNSDVLKPWMNGLHVTRRAGDMWIVDFGWSMGEAEAALYEKPFAHVLRHVKPEREKNRRENYRVYWWRHVEPRPGMSRALGSLARYIATPTIAKHRVFVFLRREILPDHQLIAIARDDYVTFGILHSRFHEVWALRLGTSLEDRPRYTPSTTFETFPFPDRLAPNISPEKFANDPRAIRIAEAAALLNERREAWLNPADLVKRVPEVVAGFPDRIEAVSDKAEKVLKERTLTRLYNLREAWLVNAHKTLDEAVAAAYGWPADLSDDEILARLLELNLARAAKQAASAPPKKAAKAKA